MKFDIVFDNNSVEIYIGKLRIEIWTALIQPISGIVVFVWPSLSLRGSPDYIGFITHLDWIIFQIGLSVRWLRDGEEI
jgi:hypothetical protein